MDIGRIDEQAARLRKAREMRGFRTAKAAADRFGFNYNTYSQHERGLVGITRAAASYARAYNVSEAWLLTGEGESDSRVVPLVGYLGAGAEIDPDYEQVPPEGLDQIDVPFPLPDDMVAFKVRGVSMLPVFKPDSIIIVYREQKKPIESFFGEEAAVRTSEGKRYIKTINRGTVPGTVNLISWNDPSPIENQRLEWVGEIFAVLPQSSLKKVSRQGGIQGNLRLRQA